METVKSEVSFVEAVAAVAEFLQGRGVAMPPVSHQNSTARDDGWELRSEWDELIAHVKQQGDGLLSLSI